MEDKWREPEIVKQLALEVERLVRYFYYNIAKTSYSIFCIFIIFGLKFVLVKIDSRLHFQTQNNFFINYTKTNF